jgi:hypothetical protein
MRNPPRAAEDKSRQMAERLVALLTGSGCRESGGQRQRTAEADPARDTGTAPDPAAIPWTRAQLRQQIQRSASWAPIAAAADEHTRGRAVISSR